MTLTLNRREMLVGAGAAFLLPETAKPKKRVAAIVTHYTHNSHADVIVSRILQGYNLDFKPPYPQLELASLYTDQVPEADMSRKLAKEHGFPIAQTIAEALTLGGRNLAVDGVLLIGEHGNYPTTASGQIAYPRRRFFEATTEVFRKAGRVVPVFSDKHLSWNWEDAQWMADTARELRIPFMAGSSVPGTWRHPAREMRRGANVRGAVALSFGGLEAYGYHGLEVMQAIIERRRGGESGVKSVRLAEGDEVWRAEREGFFASDLFDAAGAAREAKGRFKGSLREALKPAAFLIEHQDGFRSALIHDMGAANSEWVTAWKEEGAAHCDATVHYTQEARPFGHFSFLLQGVERMILTGKPSWPIERTLLVTGILAAVFESRQRGNAAIETPHLGIRYAPSVQWRPPPPPPPDRPINGQ